MTINLRPNAVPVHCCCEPAKRLGWVQLDRVPMPGRISFQTEAPHHALMTPKRSLLDPNAKFETRYVGPKRIYTEIAWLTLQPELKTDGTLVERDPILAIKSAEVPIEEWRKVVGFIEDDRSLVSDAPVR